MDLQGENRIIVKHGLRQLASTLRPGLQALIRVIIWKEQKSQPIMWDLYSDHASMQVGVLILRQERWRFCARKKEKRLRSLRVIFMI